MAATSAPRNIPHVGNIFAQKSGGGRKKELKSMRSYTPKMLSEDDSASYFDKQIEIVSLDRPSPTKEPEKPLVMGDVTSPMAVLNVNQTNDSPRSPRSPPSSPFSFSDMRNGDVLDGDRTTQNPLFGANNSSEPPKNPLFGVNSSSEPPAAPKMNGDLRAPPRINKAQRHSPTKVYVEHHNPDLNNNRSPPMSPRDTKGDKRENGMPWIPPADYDEAEFTIDFDEDNDDPPTKPKERFAEFPRYAGGDDFAKYLPDDDDINDDSNAEFTWRKNIRYRVSDRKSQTEITRHKKDKKKVGALFKSNKAVPSPPRPASTIGHGDRSTIRQFSYADSKISGYVKKPVKYHYVKKEKAAPLPPNHVEHSDYEKFLIKQRGQEAMIDYSREGRPNHGYVLDNSDGRENSAFSGDNSSQGSGKSFSTWRRFTNKFRKHNAHHNNVEVR